MREKGNVTVRQIPLIPPHEMREISGSFAELMQMPPSEDYLQLIITDEEPPADAVRQLRTVFPNLLHTLFRSSKFRETRDTETDIQPEQIEFTELLHEFYAFVNNGASLSPEQNVLLQKLLEKLDQEDSDK